jgi:hypothetical protein
MNKSNIQPVPDIVADTRRLCEIRFDCLVIMHDAGVREAKGGFLQPSKSLPPQWFRSLSTITLEDIKYKSEVELGTRLKQMYHELQAAIAQYEQFR